MSSDEDGVIPEHYPKIAYELRLKGLWKASKKWLKRHPLPPAAELFKPKTTSISVTRANTQPTTATITQTFPLPANNSSVSTTTNCQTENKIINPKTTTENDLITISKSSITTKTTNTSATEAATISSPTTTTTTSTTYTSSATITNSSHSYESAKEADSTPKLSRNKKRKMRYWAQRSIDDNTEVLSRRQAKAARKLEKELVAEIDNKMSEE